MPMKTNYIQRSIQNLLLSNLATKLTNVANLAPKMLATYL